jgi:uncharacterized protein (TIGR02246 family)
MRKWLFVLVVPAVVLLGLVGRVGLTAADPDVQRAKDRAAIDDLMWRYVRALDTVDPEAYAAVFTEDGEFGTGPGATKGSAALKKMVADIKVGQAARKEKGEVIGPMYHVITNETVEFVGADQARVNAYWMTVFGPADQNGQPRVAAVGRELDLVTRVNGKWLIKSRNVRPTGS